MYSTGAESVEGYKAGKTGENDWTLEKGQL